MRPWWRVCVPNGGEARPRNVVVEFVSFDRALEYFRSAEYQAARTRRETAGVGEFVVVEGADQ